MDWHDIRDPNDPELDRLAARYGLHPLHIEDCRHRDQIAKLEEQNGYLFVVLKPMELLPDGTLDASDLDLFVGRDFLITVEEKSGAGARTVLDRVRTAGDGQRPDQLLYRIMDGIVDSYEAKLDHFSDKIDELEDRVLTDLSAQTLASVFSTKRALIHLRRVLGNTRDVAGHLLRTEHDLIARDLWPFFRDVYDHVVRSLDLVETQRDLVNGVLDLYLSNVSNRTNRVMKILTVLGTIALPALVVSSFYGMNVEGLPWSRDPHAFGIVMSLAMLATVIFLVMLRYFRWL